jgi:hypothetical protein
VLDIARFQCLQLRGGFTQVGAQSPQPAFWWWISPASGGEMGEAVRITGKELERKEL